MRYLNSIDDLLDLMVRAAALGDEQARVRMLCDHIVRDPMLMDMPGDPFSVEYRNRVLANHAIVSGRVGYDPARDEQIPIDPSVRARRPGIYNDGGSAHLGMFLEAFGQILRVADLKPGARVLEYGPGDGQISLHLARMQCHVTVVDIEPRNLETIARQAAMLGVDIETIEADFCAAKPSGPFDLVLFFETFHHALDHQTLLNSIRSIVAPGGHIIFAGEPIIPAGDFWAAAVPFPWGLRLDALSLSAVKNYGWMELGFQESYFLDVLRRTGWQCEKITSTTNGRGTCYVAQV